MALISSLHGVRSVAGPGKAVTKLSHSRRRMRKGFFRLRFWPKLKCDFFPILCYDCLYQFYAASASGKPGGAAKPFGRQKESLPVHDINQKNKNDTADFLNSDEQTEQNFCRATIKCNYVPKTNYSGFAPEQAVGEKNGKKRGADYSKI